jgi:hypothetical protein
MVMICSLMMKIDLYRTKFGFHQHNLVNMLKRPVKDHLRSLLFVTRMLETVDVVNNLKTLDLMKTQTNYLRRIGKVMLDVLLTRSVDRETVDYLILGSCLNEITSPLKIQRMNGEQFLLINAAQLFCVRSCFVGLEAVHYLVDLGSLKTELTERID